ncbi:hypothetical protein ABZ559_04605 [Streptococcus sp. ZY19097]|uniref:hypothetical protein n=1 Tax=Streptococcus sp. ZY19097 TaxID=3231906 RepID=UPI00345A52FB
MITIETFKHQPNSTDEAFFSKELNTLFVADYLTTDEIEHYRIKVEKGLLNSYLGENLDFIYQNMTREEKEKFLNMTTEERKRLIIEYTNRFKKMNRLG